MSPRRGGDLAWLPSSRLGARPKRPTSSIGKNPASYRGSDRPTGTLRDEAVKILPMHSVRGLQFRIVQLLLADLLPSPFKEPRRRHRPRPILCRHDAGRGHASDFAFRQLVLCRGTLPRVGDRASI